jgi:hypothetical protein
MASQNGHLLFSGVVLTLFFSYVLSVILTKERFLQFQLRQDNPSLGQTPRSTRALSHPRTKQLEGFSREAVSPVSMGKTILTRGR